jgi:NAD(P)H-flavin reductase
LSLKGPELHDARLGAKDDAGGGLVRLSLEAPAPIVGSYVTPGQYVAFGGGGKTSFFVLAGDPGAATWELVLRPGGDVVTAALAVAPGEAVSVSAAQGDGFPMEEAKGHELLVLVTGSGMAAARPVVRARVRDGEARTTELLAGFRTVADVPMRSELDEWTASGVKVTVCLSRQPGIAGAPWFVPGYVQDEARRHVRADPGKRRIIFAAGVKPMIDAVRLLAKELGVHESDVRTNY